MKKLATFVVLLGVFLCFTSAAWAVKGPQGVSNTTHNLAVSGPVVSNTYWSQNVEQVCVFCHTPHGGILNGPLWNRSLPDASSFTHYNSVTLSDELRTNYSVNRDIRDESLLCMSCHDGSVAVDHLINNPNEIGTDPVYFFGNQTDVDMKAASIDTPWARIGTKPGSATGTGQLEDDHPISFSYTAVYNDPMYQSGSKAGELYETSVAVGKGVRFFGPVGEDYLECSSCHDPHVDYEATGDPDYAPFLITPNTGSALCLACHNK